MLLAIQLEDPSHKVIFYAPCVSKHITEYTALDRIVDTLLYSSAEQL